MIMDIAEAIDNNFEYKVRYYDNKGYNATSIGSAISATNARMNSFAMWSWKPCVTVMDMTAKKTHVIINSPEQLEALYKANMKEIWCGFNSLPAGKLLQW